MSDEENIPWFEDHDPFSMLGYVRIIVVRHNPQRNWRGELENCIYIAAVDGFYLGFQCNPIERTHRLQSVLPTYKDDVENCEHKINHLFKNKKNGIYELTGEMWAWSSQSYEGDWNGDTEVRNHKIQEISFNDAIAQCDIGEGLYEELVRLLPRNPDKEFDELFHNNIDIHTHMTKKQIYVNHANVLTGFIDKGHYGNRPNYNDSTVEELEACIHMMMLQIDSEKHLEQWRQMALDIDRKVKNVLMDHFDLMEEYK